MNTLHTRTPLAALAATAVLLLALTGCAGTATAEPSATTAPEADSITVEDAWVKTAEEGMSAAFGTIENTGDTDVVIVGASTAASPMIELHETVEDDSGAMVMRQKEGGFVIPAGDHLHLEPGGNHIMLMGLADPIVAGDEVTFTLEFEDGSTLEFTAPGKDYEGANETYEGDMDMDR
ncbi:copper chaperone PCu(A)C [Microbacterium sp. NPDC064584]|uniref:copper chaperone PCu(A)C n=1 Tax=Microbacterium sp. NPDC064584 TaxID=3155817 RepID=UPI0034360F33